MDALAVLGWTLGWALGAMGALWLLSLALRDSSIVDIFWGIGYIVLAGFYFLSTPDGAFARKLLITGLVGVWGLRLSIHILLRNWGKGEDFRYRAWREAAGESWWWESYFRVFLLQGVLLWLVSVPLLAAQVAPEPTTLTALDLAGILIWGIGFTFEAVGDWQLTRFRANPANQRRLLTEGLWRYTRHPNYFGDAVQWWGFFLIAAAAGGWLTVFSPLLMTALLLRVSGVSMLERTLRETKPGYEAYMQRTPAFFPWFPRRR